MNRIIRAAFSSSASQPLVLTMAAPHQTIYKSTPIHQLNISTEEGDLGILCNHTPVIVQLRPGIIEVVEQAGQPGRRWFGSGGFATVNPDNTVQVGVMEAVGVDELDRDRVLDGLKKAEAVAGQSDEERAEAAIHAQVFKAMAAALGA